LQNYTLFRKKIKIFLLLQIFRIPTLYFCSRKGKGIITSKKDKVMFTKQLSRIEVKCGLIRFGSDNRDMFPANGETVRFIDNYGEEYITHTHRTVNRVDGLTAMHKNNNAHEGTTITVRAIDGQDYSYQVIYG
jgi:hypothetical protein